MPTAHPQETWPTEQCRACGYSLRGLPSRGQCPECGEAYPPERSLLAVHRYVRLDAPEIMRADGVESGCWRWGLRLCLTATMIALVMQVAPLIARDVHRYHAIIMVIAALIWCLGLPLAIPGQLAPRFVWLRRWRRTALLSQGIWIGVFAAEAVFVDGSPTPQRTAIDVVVWCAVPIAGLGLMMMLPLLATIARDLDLRATATRLRLCLLMFPIWGTFVWVSDYPSRAVDPPEGLLGAGVWLVLLMMLIPWWTMFLLTGHAWLQMLSRARWAVRTSRLAEGRDERIRAKRAAMRRSSGDASSARPAPSDDIPLEPSSDADGEAPDRGRLGSA